MTLILRIGPGIKKLSIPIGKKEFEQIDEQPIGKDKIEIYKTSHPWANHKSIIEEWKFIYKNEENITKSYILGHQQGEKDFYIRSIQSMEVEDSSHGYKLLTLLKYRLNQELSDRFSFIEKKEIPFKTVQNDRSYFHNFNFTTNYLKEKGFRKIQAQADHKVFNIADMGFRMGWRDVNRERKLEQFVKNIPESKKHLTRLEKISGTVHLEYILNPDENQK